jgi:CubicO group peptidase (beta-lactamase class C family)
LLLVSCLNSLCSLSGFARELWTDAALTNLLQGQAKEAAPDIGFALAVVEPRGVRRFCIGKMDGSHSAAVNADTLFEIGSVTKVFTSLVLADMVQKGEVNLDDPISKFLPATVKVPTRKGKEITLIDLATHSSSLPRLPTNLGLMALLWHGDNPYARYTVQDLYDFLSDYTLPRDIGERYEYSNVGGGLLGHVLALKAGTNYEAMVLERICQPLGMTNTFIHIPAALKATLATGHNEKGKAVPNWDMPALEGAGALRSSANDLVKLIQASLCLDKTSLKPALDLASTPRRSTDLPATRIGLGWHILSKDGRDLVWHNGGTGGYRSFVGFDKQRQFGFVLLSNSAKDVDALAFELLRGEESP